MLPPSNVPTHVERPGGDLGDVPTWAATGGPGTPHGLACAELEPGAMVADTFRVVGRLGAGAMGVVYRAHHLKLDRPVALKVHRAGGPNDALRLEREARAMARLNHPNVIHVYDVGTFGDGRSAPQVGREHSLVFVAMEYVDGGTAREWLARRPPWQEALAMILQAGEGLAAAHAVGMIHRDFKPENILIGNDGRARVADFGLAQPTATPASPTLIPHGLASGSTASTLPGSSPFDATLTGTGGIAGTPAYMAPEQFGVGKVDARADVFAFCVVAWEALYGRRPFAGQTPAEILFRASAGKIEGPAVQGIPAQIEQILRRGLTGDAHERPGNLAAVLGELRRAAAAKPGPSTGSVATGVVIATALVVGGAALAWTQPWTGAESAPSTELIQAEAEVKSEPPEAELEAQVLSEADANDGSGGENHTHEPLLDAEAIAALTAAMMNPDELDGAALVGALLPKEALGEEHGLIGALIEKQIADAKKPVAPIDVPDDIELSLWDGSETLTCMMGERIRIRDKHVTTEQAPAFRVMSGCLLHVVDCTIEAPKVLEVLGGRAVFERVRIKSSDTAISVSSGNIDLREVDVDASAAMGIQLSIAKAWITDSAIRGDTAIEANARSQAHVENSRIEGKSAAIRSVAHARVALRKTTYDGSIVRTAGGAVVELADD